MIFFAYLAFIAFSTLVALNDRKRGLLLFFAIGLTQDPVRKLIPGAPGYFTLCAVPVFFAMIVELAKTHGGFLRDFGCWHPKLASTLFLFFVSLLPGAALSATYGPGSWLFTVVGLLSYGTIILGILLGFFLPEREGDLERFLTVYCALAAPMLGGAFLEYFGVFPNWKVLGTSVLGHEWVRHIPSVVIKMVAGFFRSPDIMGWHAAMVLMLSSLFALRSRSWIRLCWIAVACWAFLCMVLCGRRKMMYMLPFFASIFLWALLFLSRGSRRTVSVGILVAILLVSLTGYQVFAPDSAFLKYYTYETGEILARVEQHGLKAVAGTFTQSGLLGEGLGFASTGSHHIHAPRPRVWQEGGLSRIAVELGLPGLMCFLFFGWRLVVCGLKIVVRRFSRQAPVFQTAAALFAILVANAASFVVSGQHFGDPFISSFIAVLVGLFLSTIRHFEPISHTNSAVFERTEQTPAVVFGEASKPPVAARGIDRWEDVAMSYWSRRL